MGILDFATDEVGDAVLMDDGTEVTLRITNVIVKPTADGSKNGITVFLEPTGDHEEAEDLIWWSELPTPERRAEDPKACRQAERRLAQFYKCFQIEDDASEEEMAGLEGDVIVGHQDGNDEYGPSNRIKKFVLPK